MSRTIISDAELLQQIRGFCETRSLKPTTFGRLALGDGSLISNLEAGRSLTLRNAAKVFRFMASYRSTVPQAKAA